MRYTLRRRWGGYGTEWLPATWGEGVGGGAGKGGGANGREKTGRRRGMWGEREAR